MAVFAKASSTKKTQISGRFKEQEKAGRPGLLGGIVGSGLNILAGAAGAVAGFKTAGPAGATGGAFMGAAATETVKHYATAAAGAVMNRGGGGGDSTLEGLRAAVQGVAEQINTGPGAALQAASAIIEQALSQVSAITDGSTNDASMEVVSALHGALAACDEARTQTVSASQNATTWASGL